MLLARIEKHAGLRGKYLQKSSKACMLLAPIEKHAGLRGNSICPRINQVRIMATLLGQGGLFLRTAQLLTHARRRRRLRSVGVRSRRILTACCQCRRGPILTGHVFRVGLAICTRGSDANRKIRRNGKRNVEGQLPLENLVGPGPVADPSACHENGRLRHGVTEELITATQAAGFTLSETEIKYRMQVAREELAKENSPTAVGEFSEPAEPATWKSAALEYRPDITAPTSASAAASEIVSSFQKHWQRVMDYFEYSHPLFDDFWGDPTPSVSVVLKKIDQVRKKAKFEYDRTKQLDNFGKRLLRAVGGDDQRTLGEAIEILANSLTEK